MAREIPEVVRAAAGLAATVLDEARKLPETLPGIPVRILGMAMQQAMKVQQQYAGLVARGDELFTGFRGEDEPGLATFDDDESAPASSNGFRESAFDRTADTFAADDTLTDAEVEALPEDPAADAVTSAVDDLAEQVETGRQSIEEIIEEAPAIEEILDEIAIDELVDQAPTLDETAPRLAPVEDTPATEDADAVETALAESGDSPSDAAIGAEPTVDVATTVDVLTPTGEVASVEATVTDEGVATAPPAPDGDTVTATDEGGAPVAAAAPSGDSASSDGASTAPRNAPVDGYDAFSVAQLRGRLRGYALTTVQELVDYEQATRNRAPYLTMLRNRLEKLEEQAIESSPLAPRGA